MNAKRSEGINAVSPVMFDRLGAIVSRNWALVLVAWAIVATGIHLLAPRWEDVTQDGDFAYLPEAMTSVQGERLLEAAFPDVLSKSQVVLVLSRADGELTGYDRGIADQLVEYFTPTEGQDSPIVGILSHRTEVLGEKLTSPAGRQGQAMLIILQLRNEFMAIGNWHLMREIYDKLHAVRSWKGFPAGLELGVTGSAAIGFDMLASAEESIRNTEATTLLLVLGILMVVYRAPGLVLVPVATIAVSVLVAMNLVALIAHGTSQIAWLDLKIFKTTRIFIVVILFGAGVDYCLFLISRYKEELQRGLARRDAIARALACVGDALTASALTTIVGLATMALADFGKFRNSGPVIALCLVVALVASMTLAPAVLRAIGRIVFWPFGVPVEPPSRIGTIHESALIPSNDAHPAASSRDEAPVGDDGLLDNTRLIGKPPLAGFWNRVSQLVIAHPGLILLVSVVLLSPLVYRGLSVEVNYDLLSELRADRPSVRGTRQLRQHFPAGETGPVTVLAFNEKGRFDEDKVRWQKIQKLADSLYELEYEDSAGRRVRPIRSVRSALEPLGEKPEKIGGFSAVRKGVLRGHQKTKDTYLAQAPEYAGKVTRFDLVFAYDPFSAESIRLLDHVEESLWTLSDVPNSPWSGTDFYFVGTTAGIRDLRRVTSSDQIRIQILVPIAVLAILVLVLRRPLVCSYLILSVLFGYFVTMGATQLFFAWLYGDTFHGLDWKVPIFLFVILIAVGQDYNVYLVTRVFEEQKRHGATEGLRVGLVRTGGIITSCGLIMAGTFASMSTGTLRAMHELGFALSLGVMLDTFVIRTILVPCFLVLWAKRQEDSTARDTIGAQGHEGATFERVTSRRPTEGARAPRDIPAGRG